MKSWLKNSVHSVNAAVLTTILSAEQAFGAEGTSASLKTAIDKAMSSGIVSLLVTGSCIAMGVLEAIKIWKAMFGGGGDIWKDVLALLGWIIFAVYWKDLLGALMAAFT